MSVEKHHFETNTSERDYAVFCNVLDIYSVRNKRKGEYMYQLYVYSLTQKVNNNPARIQCSLFNRNYGFLCCCVCYFSRQFTIQTSITCNKTPIVSKMNEHVIKCPMGSFPFSLWFMKCTPLNDDT